MLLQHENVKWCEILFSHWSTDDGRPRKILKNKFRLNWSCWESHVSFKRFSYLSLRVFREISFIFPTRCVGRYNEMEVIVQGNKLNGLIQAVGFQNMKVSGDSGVQFVIMMNKVSLTNCTQPDDSNYNNDTIMEMRQTVFICGNHLNLEPLCWWQIWFFLSLDEKVKCDKLEPRIKKCIRESSVISISSLWRVLQLSWAQ